eukprot:5066348-Amphidinium_carterae.1
MTTDLSPPRHKQQPICTPIMTPRMVCSMQRIVKSSSELPVWMKVWSAMSTGPWRSSVAKRCGACRACPRAELHVVKFVQFLFLCCWSATPVVEAQ